MNAARMVVWSLRSRALRVLGNVLIMALAVSVVIVFVSVVGGLVFFAKASHDELIIGLPRPRLEIADQLGQPASLYPKLQKIDGVQAVSRYILFDGHHEESGTSYGIAGEEVTGLELHRGRFAVAQPDVEAWAKEPIGAIVSEALSRALNLPPGKLAQLPTGNGPLQIKVIGLSPSPGFRVAIHLEYAQEFLKARDVCEYRIFTRPEDFARVAAAVAEVTKSTGSPLKMINLNQLTTDIAHRASLATAVLGFLGVLLVLVTTLTLANATAIGIRERRIETATFRVIGFRRMTVLRALLNEALVVGLLGGVLGIAVTMLVLHGSVQLTPGTTQLLPPVKISSSGITAGLLISIVVPLLGALPSAWAAIRRPLVDALRETA